ncbi:energy transducer TonB [Tepidimonas fonticaldi]|uniref:Energy transducer TonB n=1 Tax=Tepidimonas fonticaldi TaxID=1101373 RepID=A0A1A6DSF9_9BURK|nr:TonB family protein [Tepidimonas fonticaldi]OBS29740.1 energy transducer TonB [Tepidimonas fonticaldi]
MVLPRALASLSTRFRADPLPWALAVSVAVHAAVLTVRFVPPLRPERVLQDTPLEVILVNARGEQAPERPQAIAQANLAGGGDADRGRATSPLPPAMLMRAGDALDDEEQRIEAMKERQSRLLAQLRQEIARLSAPQPADASDAQAREQLRQALVKTLAEIEKRINEENARPRKRYISPATREAVYALYYDELRRRIEDRGTAQFPEQGGRKLYGELTMVITVNHDGRVLDTEVVQSSGIPYLDSRAQAIVRSLQFARFNQAMRQRADQIVVVSRFRFTRDAGLQTQMSGTR